MNAITKKVVAVMAAVVMAVTTAVSVSADYLNVDMYGIYDANGKLITVGDSLIQNKYYYRWSLSSVSPDYTYDCWIQITSEEAIEYKPFVISNSYKSYYSNSVPNLTGVYNNSSWIVSDSLLGSLERISDKSYKVHVYWNSNVTNFYSATLQLQQTVYCTGFNNIKIISQGVGVYYDPGGDTFSELIYEYGSANPLPDVKDVKEQGAAMSSAEAAVRDKSSDLVSSVESDWSAMQNTAKAGVTSLQPAAATVNSAFGLVMDELPDEVKILFVAIPILLFIGWLIGRVRE